MKIYEKEQVLHIWEEQPVVYLMIKENNTKMSHIIQDFRWDLSEDVLVSALKHCLERQITEVKNGKREWEDIGFTIREECEMDTVRDACKRIHYLLVAYDEEPV